MTPETQKALRYWRTSLADGALGRGRFRQYERRNFLKLSAETLGNGVLPKNQVEKVFVGQGADIEIMSVQLWPILAARKMSHGVTISSGLPEIVAPVITQATVDRDGKLRPSRSTIARDLLAPLPNDEFALGPVETFDTFLAANPFSPDETSPVWAQYRTYCRAMLDAVSPHWPGKDDRYVSESAGFMRVAANPAATTAHAINLYDMLLEETPDTPLLEQIAAPASHQQDLPETTFTSCLGHATDAFPLAEHQRGILSCLSSNVQSEVLAVNGPPGTGKTTLLLSVIADAWVRAALDGGAPPVIVAASTNNQAVTNIIDAFGKDFAEGQGVFAGRWLPDLKSYGVFLPARIKETTAARQYQTERFFEELETREYYERAQAAFLTAGQTAFPDHDRPDVREIVSLLHGRISDEVSKLFRAEEARKSVIETSRHATDFLGEDPRSRLVEIRQTTHDLKAAHDLHKSWEAHWARYQAEESGLLVLFSSLPPVARKRAMKARIALEDSGCTLDLSGVRSVADIEGCLQDGLNASSRALEAAQEKYKAATRAVEDMDRAEQDWEAALAHLDVPLVPVADACEADRRLDCTIRFRLFQMACHYWEGRWVLDMEENLDDIVGSHRKTGRKTVEPRWHRRMMLTPCAVSTFATLPGKMRFDLKSDGDWKTHYLYGFIDLLIADEAGQVLPEVAAPSFALAKRSLIIGDTQQIAPITRVSEAVDTGNLQSAGLLDGDYTEDDLRVLSLKGLRTVDGSLMRLAQAACPYAPYPDLERGLYLFEHRRCYDEIINFCNTLCYSGTLKPLRGAAPEEHVLPAMGYVHVDGMAVSYGGSRANTTEAVTIADWLATNRSALERHYARKLENIVGVVTPFGRQVQDLRKACSERDISAKMTIGTVHALQGAERPVVIFSMVYSKHSDGPFIDMSPSMLNVTVSRARDSFLIFGDMDMVSGAATGTPRAVLAKILFSAKGTALDYTPQPRVDLTSDQPITTLRDAAGHDRFMMDALASPAREFSIVSPWAIARTMERAGLLDAFRKATGRGATIDVFVDPLLNQSIDDSGQSQLETAKAVLTGAGVHVHEVRQLHSKVFIIGHDQLCIGSYNWLSADRDGRYARHETSIAYSGAHLDREITLIKDSLGAREDTRGRRLPT